MMKFTVVIPVYNRVVSLDQAIRSVLVQTCQDFEIIIVDDGSREPICPSVSDRRMRVIRHPRNRGAAAARNTGIRNAKGELIAFLDSDDLWFPQKLEKQAEFMSDLSYGACVTSYEYDTEEGFKYVIPHKPRSWLYELAKECHLSPGTTLVVRRSCYPLVGLYDESMPRHEDYDWLLRFVQQLDLGVLEEEPLARICRSGLAAGSLMEISNQMIIDRYGKEFLKLNWFYGRWAIGRRLLETAVHYAVEGNKPKSIEYLWRAMITHPLQSPGMYLRIFDKILGTSIFPIAKRLWFKLSGEGYSSRR